MRTIPCMGVEAHVYQDAATGSDTVLCVGRYPFKAGADAVRGAWSWWVGDWAASSLIDGQATSLAECVTAIDAARAALLLDLAAQLREGGAVSKPACATCRHWAYEPRDAATPVESAPHEKCGAIVLFWGFDGTQAVPRAFTSDADGHRADLWTAPDFSCALHEPKAPALREVAP